jgi:hypothetical protein
MRRAIHPLPPYTFMAWYLVKNRDNSTFTANTTTSTTINNDDGDDYDDDDDDDKVKVNLPVCLTKHHAMKTYRRNGGIAPCILDLGTRWR